MSAPLPLAGRVALVTGASRGIGRGIARALASHGARVMAVARGERELAAVAEEIGGAYVAVSLASEDGCRRVVEETRARLGSISLLVNNAGDADTADGRAWELDGVAFRAKLAVNLDAPFHLTRLALPDMLAAGFGRIVNVASTAGLVAGPGMTAFTVSKHGLVGLTRAVAIDAGHGGITCNAVCPGWVRTGLTDASAAEEAAARGVSLEAVWDERGASYPAGRVVSVEEVASVVTYLCSDAASGVNGEAIRVALGSSW